MVSHGDGLTDDLREMLGGLPYAPMRDWRHCGDELHVFPEFSRAHHVDGACWCHPRHEELIDGSLVLHRAVN